MASQSQLKMLRDGATKFSDLAWLIKISHHEEAQIIGLWYGELPGADARTAIIYFGFRHFEDLNFDTNQLLMVIIYVSPWSLLV